MNHVGTHCVLELYGCEAKLLNDVQFILGALRRAAEASHSTHLAEVSHAFTPQGVTALALLAESHISIHTWPENGYAAIDVFTCGEHTRPEQACAYLQRALRATESYLRKLPRGRHAPQGTFTVERVPTSGNVGTESEAESTEEPAECQVLRFERTSGSTNTSLPGTSTNMA